MVIRDKNLQRVYHVLLYCARIRMTVRDIGDYAAFITSENFVQRDACCFYLLQIGELVRTLSVRSKMRMMISHGNRSVVFATWSRTIMDMLILKSYGASYRMTFLCSLRNYMPF